MKKSLCSAFFIAAVAVVAVTVPCASAAAETFSQTQFDIAVKNYKKSFIDGLCLGIKLGSRGKVVVSTAQRSKMENMADDFIHKALIPAMQRNDLTAVWVKAQLDPELIQLNNQGRNAKNIYELQLIMGKGVDFINRKYPQMK